MRTHLVILLSLVLGASACKKKDEAKPAEPATAEKKADEAAKPAEPAAPPAGAVKIADANDYEAKATDLTNKLLALFTAAGKDCDKLAADLTKFGNDNKNMFEALKAFEETNADAKKAFDEKMKGREKEFEAAIGPAFEACKDHEGLQKAMQAMPLD